MLELKYSKKELLMELRQKKLSVYQLVGYEDGNLEGLPTREIGETIYKLGCSFINDMMDTVYSDGPIYFKSFPFDVSRNVIVFTTFGNGISPTGEDTGPIIFKQRLLIDSENYGTVLASDLQKYYDSLSENYPIELLSELAVYHVLYYQNNQLVVEAYSNLEEG